MAINEEDQEIMRDFLIEAGEILDQLGEQLVALEHAPQDKEILNSVFRGFHTIKGGAGFLNIAPLVEICHGAEDVFNTLRQGARLVSAPLMDAILKVHDEVNRMFERVRRGAEPAHADRALLERLRHYAQPEERAAPPAPPEAETPPQAAPAEPGAAQGAAGGAEITDEEFEALLDQLHGVGVHGGAPAARDTAVAAVQSEEDAPQDDEAEAPAAERGTAEVGSEVPAAARRGRAAAGGAAPKKDAAQGQAEATVRVDTKRLDDIMNLVGELVLVRNRLTTLESTRADEEMAKAVGNLDLVTGDLQAAVMKTRMQPVKKVFGRFPRVVRDLARQMKKEVNLEMHGEETDLDKNLVEALADPLVHLVRNAVDHGIELPEERARAGKPRTGSVVLSAEQEGDHILLTISDDGAGIDPEKLRSKAVEKGLLEPDAAERLSKQECYQLIFLPGFSTKTEITDVSGRGVGMDVVKTKITQLNGTVQIESEPGRGSHICIKVPLTLAIMPTLMVKVEEQVFALPLGSVVEIFTLDLNKTNVVDGQEVVLIRNKALPIFYLRKWLLNGNRSWDKQASGHVVIVHAGARLVGFVVDKLLGQEEVVIKPLGALLHGTQGLAGATITGDGRISIILDVPGLMTKYARTA